MNMNIIIMIVLKIKTCVTTMYWQSEV